MARIPNFVTGLLRRADEAFFGADDQFARIHGWEVRAGRFGLSRAYHHPAFDRLVCCQQCKGDGHREEAACIWCAGTGRIVLGNPVLTVRR